MKIGIISINAHTKVLNFASPLHSYAFQQFLKMHGYDSVIIDYKPNYYGQYNPRHPLFYQLSHPMKNKKKQRAALKKWLKLFIPRQIRFDKFQRFIDKYYIQRTSAIMRIHSIQTIWDWTVISVRQMLFGNVIRKPDLTEDFS